MKKKSVWVEDLKIAEKIWNICYKNKGWDLFKTIEKRWSWYEMKYMYNFVVIEKTWQM